MGSEAMRSLKKAEEAEVVLLPLQSPRRGTIVEYVNVLYDEYGQ